MPYQTIQNSYETNYYTGLREDFAIYSALNCGNRHPTEKNTCFCSEPIKNSIFSECKKYDGKNNQCMEAVCCQSCDINKQNKCPF